ncbi:MAG: glutamate synthase large subunit [Cytophagales bacterium]|nr:glutamate synthase large subunit [Cytophagales bacterium]
MTENLQNQGLYHPSFEKDACGIGFVANLKGRKSHQIVNDALHMLTRMYHRGACGCEVNTGDGAGILLQLPHEFFVSECIKLGFKLPEFGKYGVGMIFFPSDEKVKEDCREILNRNIEKLGFNLLGYRKVPTDNIKSDIGPTALLAEPSVEQVFVQPHDEAISPEAFERKLFILRNYVSKIINESVTKVNNEFYFTSFSYKTIVYKGQLTTHQVEPYFPDLQRQEVVSALAVVHSRFSTNTFPSWKLAQPFRYLAHNGEINTVKGNVNWVKSNEPMLESSFFTKEELEMIKPVCNHLDSDSANLDYVVELLTLSGRSLPHVMMMLVPEAWDGNEQMEEWKKAFYEYHASIMEPWDGPASISFTDGKIVGATLDRNGLRPSRYCITDDDTVIMASEAGVIEVEPSKIVLKGRLQAGRMFIVDLEQGRIVSDDELKKEICSKKPYREWLNKYKINLKDLPAAHRTYLPLEGNLLLKKQLAFGYTSEDLKMIIAPMAEDGKEPVGSMGNDTPLAILSDQAQHISSYFKQLFAQVTNPPIDPIRERMVMSLVSYIGGSLNVLDETPKHCHTVYVNQPVLSNKELETLRYIDHAHFQTKTIPIVFFADKKQGTLQRSLDKICQYAADAVDDGYEIILLSDRGIDSDHAPIPSILATAAVHHHLIKRGLRSKVGLVVEAGDVWEVHHFALLIGYGASAVNPYLAFETINALKKERVIKVDYTEEKLHYNYIKAVGDGLLKIMSKMGISTIQSYNGAQIFEALGISKKVIDKYFTGTVSRIEGLDLDGIAKEANIKHSLAFPEKEIPNTKLEVGGVYQWKRRGEFHLFNPESIHLLQLSTRKGDYSLFKKFTKLMNEQTRKACTLRGLLRFKPTHSISIDEVEPVESIVKRFATGAMSFGSISHEAHSTLAVAMNRLGGKSNTGEGGEDEIRYEKLANGDSMRSSIKQVASARFGVTSRYLTEADELQIKMAQGAKPGEGGQLPGHKVDEWIGKVRHSTPGVGLISPPPHHDIYSIEDLAQLIFDLKNANRKARISVKLVSEAGVGTIAAGVAKAKSDVVLIAGHDGGTGASPVSSIRHAGLPWELGLAETHQTLVKNKLRSRIVVQTDGQLRTGKDLAVAAMLGAEEWGIATGALVVEGCIMMRKCHLNTCPVGVATQDPELRKRFAGKPEYVVNFFTFLAQELREIMAELGFKTVNEMVGRVDMLELRENITHWKYKSLDLSKLLYKEDAGKEVGLYKMEEQDHGLVGQLDFVILEKAKSAIESGQKFAGEYKVTNTDRAIGTILSNEITKVHKSIGLPKGTLSLKFTGSAGQSFGAFTCSGLKLELEGEANDYFGKGLSGAQLILYPDKKAKFSPSENIIVGNVSFYGATSGEAYIRGRAGERFCVRNSGVTAVVEGVGDHGCEYMTGGTALILGDTGRNFAAGMSGGVAYIYDPNSQLQPRCNMEMIYLEPLDDEDEALIKKLLQNHLDYTKSDVAEGLLSRFNLEIKNFIKVMPKDYKAVLMMKKQNINKGKEVAIHG